MAAVGSQVMAASESAQTPVTIYAGQLVDGNGGVRKNVVVTIEGSKIKPATRILYAYENAYKDFMGGFTTVQGLTSPSLGSPSDIDLRDAIARGEMPGPRIVASVGLINEKSGTPDEIRQKVREQIGKGADLVKLFASKSIRERGEKTMSDEQIAAACQEAKALGKRTWVHAHSAESVRASVLGGCNAIAHGAFATEEEFKLMAEHGVYFEPDIALLGYNYLANQERFIGTPTSRRRASSCRKRPSP